MGVLIRGFMIGNDREKVLKAKGEAGVKLFDQEVGRKRYNPAKNYPIEESVKCQKTAAKIIYRNESQDAFRKLGAWDFKMVIQMQMFKVVFALFAPSLEKAVENITRLLNAVYVGMKASSKTDLKEGAQIIIENDPYPAGYFQGLFEEAMRYFGCAPNVEVVEEDSQRIFTFRWKK